MPKQINMNRSIQFEGIKVSVHVNRARVNLWFCCMVTLISGEAWRPLSDMLAENFRVISVDIPGHGGSGVAGRDSYNGVYC